MATKQPAAVKAAQKKKSAAVEEEDEDQGAGFSDDDEGDGVVVDLSEVQDNFEVLPKGVYPAIVHSVEYQISQNSGNPMWKVTMEISEGEYEGRKFPTYLTWRGNGLPGTKRTVTALWPSLLEGPFNAREVAESGDLEGTACRIRLDIRPYEGQKRNNIRSVLPAEAD